VQRLSRRLRGAAARCGFRTNVAHYVHVPLYSHTTMPSIRLDVGLDYDQNEIRPSQVQGPCQKAIRWYLNGPRRLSKKNLCVISGYRAAPREIYSLATACQVAGNVHGLIKKYE
jgi:hypothetical protein